MLPALLGLLPSLASGVKEYIGKKQDLQKLTRESEVRIKTAKVDAEIRRIESADKADGVLDEISLRNAGWMDDYLVVLTTLPIVGIIIAPYTDMIDVATIQASFTAMSDLPEYYWYALGAVYIRGLGMRRMARMLIDKMSNPFKK